MGVMAAGPFMNFLLGFLIILAVRVGAGEYAFLNSTRIGRLTAESPLKTADVRPGDRIISVSGREVEDWAELSQALADARGKQAVLEVLREERSFVVSVSVDADATSLGIDPFIPSTAGSVLSGRPAETAGLLPGDRIVSVDGVPVAQWWEMSQRISARPEQEIEIRWLRDGVEYAIQITPGAEEVQGKTVGRIGIGMSRTPVGFGKAVLGSGNEMLRFTTAIFLFIKQLLSGEASGRALAGPVMIAQMAGESARQGWEALLSFMALLSVNLAILNLLPIPMLDGGHLMILTVEAAMRRPLSARHKEVLQRAGFAFLLFVMLYVTLGDITRIFGWFNQ
jgi:regulator of sigma E protease